mgnify:CR=1 FL=1
MPVFGVDGITDGEMAEKAILQAGVDMIDVGRGFLVNPNFGNDVLEGRSCGKCLHCRPACKWSPFLNDDGGVPGKKFCFYGIKSSSLDSRRLVYYGHVVKIKGNCEGY